MKKFLLLLGMLTCSLFSFAENKDDFSTITANTSYGTTKTSTAGWTGKYCASIQVNNYMSLTMNGKIGASSPQVGVITSPILKDGISKLTFHYTNNYSEKNGVKVQIDIMQNGKAVVTNVLQKNNADVTKGNDYSIEYSDLDIEGTFQIVFTNLCPTNSTGTGNVDRVSIYNISWENYTAPSTPLAVKPEITCVDNMVSITAEEGAKIYYTLDNTDPSNASALYSAPFAITADVTVKAIAYVDGKDASRIASLDCAFIKTYESFAELTGLDNDAIGFVNGPLTVVYQNGKNTYMIDTKGGSMLMFNQNNAELPANLVNGNTVSQIKALVATYGGEKMLYPISFGETGNGTAIDPISFAAAPVAADNYKFIKIEGATVSGAAAATGKVANFTITLANGDNLVGRNNFSIDLTDGENCTILGFVNVYNSTVQLYPISIVAGEAIETVKTPTFNPNGGDILAGKAVTISCETEDAIIYYTTDGKTPTEDSELYSEPIVINETTTITAIAVKEGMSNSLVATAKFTVVSAYERKATFNFLSTTADDSAAKLATVAGVTPDGKNDNTSKISDVEFKNGAISLVTSYGTSSATNGYPAWWSAEAGVRMYQNNKIIVSTTEGEYKITKITFTQATGNTTWATASNGATPGTLNGKVWTAKDDDENDIVTHEVTVKFGGASRFGIITVEYEPAKTLGSYINREVGSSVAEGEYIELISDDKDAVIYYCLGGKDPVVPSECAEAPKRRIAASDHEEGVTYVYTEPIQYEGNNLIIKHVAKNPNRPASAVQSFAIGSNGTVTGIDEVTSENDATVEWYDLAGRRVVAPSKGIFIKKHGNAVTKHMVK